jgi:hypothetical protein
MMLAFLLLLGNCCSITTDNIRNWCDLAKHKTKWEKYVEHTTP